MSDENGKRVVAKVPDDPDGIAALAIDMYRRIMGKDPTPEDLADIREWVEARKDKPS